MYRPHCLDFIGILMGGTAQWGWRLFKFSPWLHLTDGSNSEFYNDLDDGSIFLFYEDGIHLVDTHKAYNNKVAICTRIISLDQIGASQNKCDKWDAMYVTF